VDHSDTLEQAAEFARSAFNLMEERGIAATPDNFAIWYLYFAGRDPKMNRSLDTLLKGDEAISMERSAEIHREFFWAKAKTPSSTTPPPRSNKN
jgi:diguanylate cyclase